ncbi:nicotinate-nucleotide adenylyltransferase [Solimonas sp. SE-A11]|uniref:nicotinate-nucleotide adenylyltransferase n=1 Tax=Solimonas sp. SE-A11 TaxID=3054954 RepID=UPI00259D04E1|nr:nicotinate-nucleotide adenylyltransferase [Solimonas sp. SE-A11]MDM4770037.1 nicotinate-nucleotide adenylyltransferase [Solimonas sp. SE-A11]
MKGPIGIFGGAFAPFHHGHLRLAIEARERLELGQVRLVPTALPAHRSASKVSPQRRLEWLKLGIRREPGLVADDCEIRRGGVSYTVDTLAALRAEFPETPLVLLMGADAFAHLHCWNRWPQLLELAHLVVIARADTRLEPPSEAAAVLAGRETSDPTVLRQGPAGRWMRLDVPVLDISSTRIRRLLKLGQSVRGLVPDAILNSLTAADTAALTQDDDAKTH